MTTNLHHHVLIIGGGTAGISVAARLRRADVDDVAVLEPSTEHYYQPLWTLVGGGLAPADESVRAESRVMPKGVKWIQDAAVDIDPDADVVTTKGGLRIGYDFLVVAPGIQLDWDQTPGLTETLGRDGVSSNYRFDLAPKTWDFIRDLKGGTAVFTMPGGPIKCGGAPQKIAYLAADHWKRQGVLDDIDVKLILPTPTMFGLPEFAEVLQGVVDRYGIDVHFQSEMVEVNPDQKELVVADLSDEGGGAKTTIGYDVLHAVPRQSAPDWVKATPLAASDATGYVEVDKHTHQHVRWPNVFSLGDAGGTPNSKTGAAVRKQAPVVVQNLLDVMADREPSASYDGYSSCPIVTAHNRMVLAEFDYTMTHHKTVPLIDTVKERYDMWLLKRYGLPALYWNLMLKGLA